MPTPSIAHSPSPAIIATLATLLVPPFLPFPLVPLPLFLVPTLLPLPVTETSSDSPALSPLELTLAPALPVLLLEALVLRLTSLLRPPPPTELSESLPEVELPAGEGEGDAGLGDEG